MNMKLFLIFLLNLLSWNLSYSQDIIYKKDGSVINSSIIGPTKGKVITYKSSELVNYPEVKTISKSELKKIEYHNWKIEIIKNDSTSVYTSKTKMYKRGLYLGVCATGQNLNFNNYNIEPQLTSKWISYGLGVDISYDYQIKNNSLTLNSGVFFANCGEGGIYSDVAVKTVMIPFKLGFKIISRKILFIHPMLGVVHISASSDGFYFNFPGTFVPVAACDIGAQFKNSFIAFGFNQLTNFSGNSNENVSGSYFQLRAGINLFYK